MKYCIIIMSETKTPKEKTIKHTNYVVSSRVFNDKTWGYEIHGAFRTEKAAAKCLAMVREKQKDGVMYDSFKIKKCHEYYDDIDDDLCKIMKFEEFSTGINKSGEFHWYDTDIDVGKKRCHYQPDMKLMKKLKFHDYERDKTLAEHIHKLINCEARLEIDAFRDGDECLVAILLECDIVVCQFNRKSFTMVGSSQGHMAVLTDKIIWYSDGEEPYLCYGKRYTASEVFEAFKKEYESVFE